MDVLMAHAYTGDRMTASIRLNRTMPRVTNGYAMTASSFLIGSGV